MEWKYVKPLDDKKVVDNFLEQEHVILPGEVRNLIVSNNGGRPSIPYFDTEKNKDYVFKSLLSYNRDDKECLFKFYPDLFIGTDLYPIGMDSAGNFLCYNLKKEKLVLWNHETGKEELVIKCDFFNS